jgi:anti-anti-sigma factor
MLQTAAGWGLDVDRGPDWVFVRIHPPDGFEEAPSLAETVWAVLEQSFTYRLVLELNDLPRLHSALIGQLVLLSKRIHNRGGLLRLCGMSEENRQVLRLCRLASCLPDYESRGDAVMGHRPNRPR